MRWDRVAIVRVPLDEYEKEWPKDEMLYSHLEREVFIGLFGLALGDVPTSTAKCCEHHAVNDVSSVRLGRAFKAWLAQDVQCTSTTETRIVDGLGAHTGNKRIALMQTALLIEPKKQ